jgi:hypothetical protein
MLSPVFNVREKVLALDTRSRDFRPTSRGFQDDFTVDTETGEKHTGNLVKPLEKPDFSVSEKAAEVAKLREMNWGKVAIVEKLWNVRAGEVWPINRHVKSTIRL